MTFFDFVAGSDPTIEKLQILRLLSMLPEFDSLDTPENICNQVEGHVHELLKVAQEQYKATEW